MPITTIAGNDRIGAIIAHTYLRTHTHTHTSMPKARKQNGKYSSGIHRKYINQLQRGHVFERCPLIYVVPHALCPPHHLHSADAQISLRKYFVIWPPYHNCSSTSTHSVCSNFAHPETGPIFFTNSHTHYNNSEKNKTYLGSDLVSALAYLQMYNFPHIEDWSVFV